MLRFLASIKNTFLDIKSLLDVPYILSSLGTFLWKNGLKRTSMIAVIGYIANLFTKLIIGKSIIPYSGIAGFSIIFIFASILGLLFKFIGNLLASKNIIVAQANFLNLLEDKKKSKRKKHLKHLWDNIFKYETRLFFTPSEIEKREQEIRRYREQLISILSSIPEELAKNYLNYNPKKEEDVKAFLEEVDAFRPLSLDGKIVTEEEFMISSMFALTHSFRLSEEERLIGYDLKLLEDWYDGAYFTLEDCKLSEQIKGNVVLREIREMVKVPFFEKVILSFTNFSGKLWFKWIMKTVEVRTGRALVYLNQKFPEYDINAEHMYWPSDNLFDNYEVSEEIEKVRKKLLIEIFGRDMKTAKRRLNRFQKRNFENAFSIRKRMDPDFIFDLDEDYLKEMRLNPYRIKREIRKIKYVKDKLIKVEKYLKDHFFTLKPWEKRVILVSYLLNIDNIKSEFESKKSISEQKIKKILNRERELTKKLITLKIHSELVRIEVKDYEEELKDLVYKSN